MVHSFNFLDWGVFIVMILSVLLGFFWGLLRTLISALIWVLSFFVSMLAGPALSTTFGNYVGNGSLQLWLTYGVIFIATVIIGALARIILRFMLTPNQIGFFDRLGGAAFGFVRGILIVSVFLWVLVLAGLSNTQGGMYQTSILAGWFQPFVNMIANVFPSVEAQIQAANQNVGASQTQPESRSSQQAPIAQNNGGTGGVNPYGLMGNQDAGGGGLLSQVPGMQSAQGIMPWITTLWNMMMNEIRTIL